MKLNIHYMLNKKQKLNFFLFEVHKDNLLKPILCALQNEETPLPLLQPPPWMCPLVTGRSPHQLAVRFSGTPAKNCRHD